MLVPAASCYLLIVHMVFQVGHKTQTHRSSQSVSADLFLVTVSHPLALFPIFAVITALLTRLHTENFPTWKMCLLSKQHLIPLLPRCTKNVASACLSLCASNPTHPMAHMYYVSCVYSGKPVDCNAILAALQEAMELVKAVGKSSSRVSSAVSIMDNIFNKLQPQVSLKWIWSMLHAVEAQIHSDLFRSLTLSQDYIIYIMLYVVVV